MRRRLILVFLATSSLVTLAFVVPLAALVQRTVADRAVDAARADAAAVVPSLVSENSRDQIEATMLLTEAGQDGRMSILTSQGWRIGPDIEPTERVGPGGDARGFRHRDRRWRHGGGLGGRIRPR